MIALSSLTENKGFSCEPSRVKGYPMRETTENPEPDTGTDVDSSANILASADQILSSDAPIRVQLRRTKGWRMPSNTVKVDRTNKKFGNIFTIGCNPSQFSAALPMTCSSAADAVSCFRYYADTWMALSGGNWIAPLKGKNLACWCSLDAPCHADVLLELANKP